VTSEGETILKLFQCSVSGMYVRTSEIKLQLNNAAGGRLKRKNCFISGVRASLK